MTDAPAETTESAPASDPTRTAHVVLVGAGLMGSAMAGELAHMPNVAHVTVVDPDDYEAKNLGVQQIEPADVGRAKALVQAERIARLTPEIGTTAIVDRIENVAPGRLRCDAIAACLDSKAARRDVNALAHHLGVPWLDAGVDAAGGLLVRVNVYRPGPDAPCHECGWDDRAYETIEVLHPCTGDLVTAPTNSPAYLGTLAGALQAAELAKLLAGDTEHLAEGKSIVLSARFHTLDVTRLWRNPACKFDHAIWRTELLDQRAGQVTIGKVLDEATGAVSLGVEGRPFVRAAQCADCGKTSDMQVFAVPGHIARRARCTCGGALYPVGSEMADDLGSADLEALRDWPLARAGIGAGDVLRLTNRDGTIVRYELPCDRATAPGGSRQSLIAEGPTEKTPPPAKRRRQPRRRSDPAQTVLSPPQSHPGGPPDISQLLETARARAAAAQPQKPDPIFEAFLSKQCGPGLALAAASDILDLHPIGLDVPRQYLATYHVRTFAQAGDGRIGLVDRSDVVINFHDDYLRRPDPARVLTYMGPYRCFHPNIKGCYICVDVRPAMSLVDLLSTVWELLTWRLYGVADNGLNPAASGWVRQQDPANFPTDQRLLRHLPAQSPRGGEHNWRTS